MNTTLVTRIVTPTTVAVMLLVSGCAAPSSDSSNDTGESGQEAAFVEWAAENAIPFSTTKPGSGLEELMPLKGVIGDARVVGFGETIHFSHEINELKVRIFEFLVREMGFTAFVMESGLTNGKLVYDYVLGADIDRDSVLWRGFSYGFGVWEETVALLDFMRAYNADPSHTRKIRFYGADPFAMGLFNDFRTTGQYSVEAALEYLDIVDPEAAVGFRESSLLPKIAQFGSVEEYMALDPELRSAMGHAMNFVPMVGFNTIRREVMGDDYEREATTAEVARMKELVGQGMEAGAWGLGAGIEYRPARFSSPQRRRGGRHPADPPRRSGAGCDWGYPPCDRW